MDSHDNDGLGQGACEALYVNELIIEPGATLNTIACRIYYQTLTNNGTVDDPANLIEIVELAGDFDGNGVLDLIDHTAFFDCLSGPGNAPNPPPPTTSMECLDVFDFDADLDVDLFNYAQFDMLLTNG